MNYNRELAGGARSWYSGWLRGWKQEEKSLVSVVIMRGVGRGAEKLAIIFHTLP